MWKDSLRSGGHAKFRSIFLRRSVALPSTGKSWNGAQFEADQPQPCWLECLHPDCCREWYILFELKVVGPPTDQENPNKRNQRAEGNVNSKSDC